MLSANVSHYGGVLVPQRLICLGSVTVCFVVLSQQLSATGLGFGLASFLRAGSNFTCFKLQQHMTLTQWKSPVIVCAGRQKRSNGMLTFWHIF